MLLENQVLGTAAERILRQSHAKVHQLMRELPEPVVVASHYLQSSDTLKSAPADV